jgi:hypothetical protein
MHMQAMDAPDIRWGSLTGGEHGEHGSDSEQGEGEPYDEEAFKRAVREGIGPGGHRLSADMPRWRMSDRDLEDLIAFLQELP